MAHWFVRRIATDEFSRQLARALEVSERAGTLRWVA
jgi:hypothetical protein